jgi:hypothetical protein
MTRFTLYLIGNSRPCLVEVDVEDIGELEAMLTRTRYLRALMHDVEGIEPTTGVLIPTCRVQLFAEVT